MYRSESDDENNIYRIQNIYNLIIYYTMELFVLSNNFIYWFTKLTFSCIME